MKFLKHLLVGLATVAGMGAAMYMKEKHGKGKEHEMKDVTPDKREGKEHEEKK